MRLTVTIDNKEDSGKEEVPHEVTNKKRTWDHKTISDHS